MMVLNLRLIVVVVGRCLLFVGNIFLAGNKDKLFLIGRLVNGWRSSNNDVGIPILLLFLLSLNDIGVTMDGKSEMEL